MKLSSIFFNIFLSFAIPGIAGDFKQYSIEQFLDTTSYQGGVFTYDEKKVLVSSDETGVFNVFSIDLENGKKKQLTFSKTNAISILSGFPKDERFLYMADGSGDEISHIYLWENEKSTKDLTPFSGAKSEFVGWSRDEKSFLFNSNKRDPKAMDLYEMDIATFTPKLLYKNDSGLIFDAISTDKKWVALHKIVDQNTSQLYVADLTSNELKTLLPLKKETSYAAVDFSLDSKVLYFLTDENSEFAYLKQYALSTGKTETVEKYNWDISSCHFSHNDRFRAVSINEDGKTTFKIFDQKNGKFLTLPQISEGEIAAAHFAKSENSMVLAVSGCLMPPNLYFYDLASGKVKKLTESLSPSIRTKDLVEGKVIRFSSYDGMKIPALYYQPHLAAKDHKVPALILVHGGPGGQSTLDYSYLTQYLVNQGYAILAVNNRGSSGYGKSFFKAADKKHGEADLDDCIWSKKFLMSTGVIDENKIGIIGGSYGGYMTLAALAFRPNEMAVGIDIFGVSNWVRTLKSIPPWWEAERESLYQKIGNPEKEADYLISISPLFHAKKIVKPLLVIQGANDPRVLKVESDEIIHQVKENGTPHEYLVFEDEGHGFASKKNRIKAAKVIIAFLKEHMPIGNVQSNS